ncbi:DNA binding domain-containing protein, excisionase family [Mucilaginibacter pineti]|uniref:DNA binding domain-containing protein, excisionase family n=1 Tax=Mucilaginibacter pineti TaxID=1391627 RepID=A0A1G7H497_9SPHI|nr:helix-turn-helix domain-containing protein [Mucilaginibacter pineti]SDE94959.1 DNA binding domain-containing protein, excisionase family [Mucilaginibacter pineti]
MDSKEKILFTALSAEELATLMERSVRKAIGHNGVQLPDGDELLNTRQAGKLINYKASTLYGLVKQNKIPYSKTAGKLLFSRNALLAWVHAQPDEKPPP